MANLEFKAWADKEIEESIVYTNTAIAKVFGTSGWNYLDFNLTTKVVDGYYEPILEIWNDKKAKVIGLGMQLSDMKDCDYVMDTFLQKFLSQLNKKVVH